MDFDPTLARHRFTAALAGGGLLLALILALTVWVPGSPTAPKRTPPDPVPGRGDVRTTDDGGDRGDDPALEPSEHRERQVAAIIANTRESAVALEYTAAEAPTGPRRVATGVVLSDRGEVLSVRIDPPPPSAEPVVARDASGHAHPAQWLAADALTGLTLLQVEADDLRPIPPADRPPVPGMPVVVVGSPFGFGQSVSRGYIAGLDRRLAIGNRPLGGLIQLNVPLYPGDSGALLADLQGRWLGLIRSAVATPEAPGTQVSGLGFAITAADAGWVVDQLRSKRRVDRAFLGVRFAAWSANDPPGAIVSRVIAGSPADRAGLQVGDRVVAFDGTPIPSPAAMTDRLDRTLADTDVTLDYVRDSVRSRLTVRTGLRRAGPKPARTPPPLAGTDGLPSAVPGEILDRLAELEHRLDALERRMPPTPAP